MKHTIKICYLCGEPLDVDIDRDHVPPRQFYAKEVRTKHNPNLFTLPVHSLCNKDYQKDEDYFVHTIAPLAMASYSGKSLWGDLSEQYKRPQGRRIGQMVLKEFDKRPSGLILPFGKVAKRFDGQRVWRVVWKIMRGLFLKEIGRFLPDGTPRTYKIFSPDEHPPREFDFVRNLSSRGQYPGVFDYRFMEFPEKTFHFWAMLFWDKIIIFVGFHDPDCKCEKCMGKGLFSARSPGIWVI